MPIGTGQFRHFSPQHREQLGAIVGGQPRREVYCLRPVVQGEAALGFSRMAGEVVPEGDHVILRDARHARRAAAFFQRRQQVANPSFVIIPVELLLIEVMHKGVGEDFGHLHFAEQLQPDRPVLVVVMLQAAKSGHQTGGLFTATWRVDVGQKIELMPTEHRAQLAILSSGQRRNQIGLTRLRQTEEADGHRACGRLRQSACFVAAAT